MTHHNHQLDCNQGNQSSYVANVEQLNINMYMYTYRYLAVLHVVYSWLSRYSHVFNPIPDVARYIRHETFIFWCHFLQWPLLQQKGQGGERWVGGFTRRATSWFRFGNALVGSEFVTAVLLCTNGLGKESSCPAQHPFLVGKHLLQSGWAVASWVLWLMNI